MGGVPPSLPEEDNLSEVDLGVVPGETTPKSTSSVEGGPSQRQGRRKGISDFREEALLHPK